MRIKIKLRTLLIFTAICAIPCSWYAHQQRLLQQHHKAISHLETEMGPVSWYDGGIEFEYVHGVWLSGKTINDELWRDISVLTEVRSIDLAATNVQDADLSNLRNHWNIRYLSLANTEVTTIGMQTISKLDTLDTLMLGNTRIDDSAIDSLAKLRRLKTLNVIGTNLSSDGIERLRILFPKCRIACDVSLNDELSRRGLSLRHAREH